MSTSSTNYTGNQPACQIVRYCFAKPGYAGAATTRLGPPSSYAGSRNPQTTLSPIYTWQNSCSSQAQASLNTVAANGTPRRVAWPLEFMQQPTPQAWPVHGMYQPQGPLNAAYRSPRGMASPFPMHQGTPGAWINGFRTITVYYMNYVPFGNISPRGQFSPFPLMNLEIPVAWNGSGGPASHIALSNASQDGQFLTPGFQPVSIPGFHNEQGRPPQWHDSSPSPGSGYGCSPGPSSERDMVPWLALLDNNTNPGLEQSDGREQVFHSHAMTQGQKVTKRWPEGFYFGREE